jgi:AcrR family transcriptional regulator
MRGEIVRAASRREEVLAAAAECFMRRGYDTVSMDDVAEALGATKGRVYHHFASKPELFFAVYRRAMDILMERVGPLAEGPAPGAVRMSAMAREHALTLMETLPFQRTAALAPDLYRFGRAKAHGAVLEELIGLRDVYERLFREVLAQGLADGSLKFPDAALASRTLLGALNWVAVWYQPRPGETAQARRTLAARVSETVMGGYVVR